MRLGSFRFRPPWWGVVLAAAGCAAGLALGQWQSGRADEKRAAAAQVQRVALRGEFLPKLAILLDNKVHHGKAGYQVVQAFRTVETRHVLVNRGWIAAPPLREQLPPVRTPAGEHAIEGVRLERLPQAYALAGTKREGPVWQNVTVEEFSRWSGLKLEPFVLEQHSPLADGLARDWPPRGAGAEKNEAYALQWYSLAALSVVLLVVLGFRRENSSS